MQKAHEMMESQEVAIVDIRDAASFEQGHILNAQNINDQNIKNFLDLTDRSIPILCYCYHGNSSQQASVFFANQGFGNVYSIDGGWGEWSEVYG